MPSSEEPTRYTHHIPPPCDEEVEVLYADDHVIIVVKPSGLLSVPGRLLKDCALQRMQYEYPDASIVHRLDLDTSGVMAFANSKLATSDLNRQFRERQVGKEYVAEVYGCLESESGEIELPIGPDPVNRPRQLIDHENGKSALTRYERLIVGEERTRVLLKPHTGRSHQLRIHMACIDHPILGCDLYAHEAAFEASPRLLLHASQLRITHPETGEAMVFNSEVPF